MNIRRTEIVAAVILLMQVVVAVGVGPRVVGGVPGGRHDPHVHGPWDVLLGCGADHHHDHRAHVHASAACESGDHGVGHGNSEVCRGQLDDWHCDVHCCECLHAHRHGEPLRSGSPRSVKSDLARAPVVALVLPSAIDQPRESMRPWRIRHLEMDHPPPVGLRTTRLLL